MTWEEHEDAFREHLAMRSIFLGPEPLGLLRRREDRPMTTTEPIEPVALNLFARALTVTCPRCGSSPGIDCMTNRKILPEPHDLRLRRALPGYVTFRTVEEANGRKKKIPERWTALAAERQQVWQNIEIELTRALRHS